MPRGGGLDVAGPHRDVAVDATVAVVLYALLLATVKTAPLEAPPVSGVWPAYLCGAVLTLPLATRRRAPLAALVVVTAGVIAFQALQPMNLVVPLAAVALAVYSAGVHGPPVARDVLRAGVGLALVGLLLWMFATVDAPPDAWPPRVALYVVLFAAAWAAGDQMRRSSARERELAVRTAQLEVERERSARQAATEERLSIARELHDVLGHHVSVMAVQAAGAQRVLTTDPERAATALEAIEGSSRQVVAEMQRVLTMLRDGEDGGPHGRPGLSRPGLSRLDEVVAEVRDAGVEVTLEVDELPSLPAHVDLAATRVVQEALTNVLRHAGVGTSARVRITGRNGQVGVVVEDDGRGQPSPTPTASVGSGRGLLGLRERIELHRGRFDASPRPHGGFRVTATLPIAPEPPVRIRST